MNDERSKTNSFARHRVKKLKVIGVVVLALGIVSAGLVYWLETRGANLSDDISMLGFNRATQRQMGQLYGKSGLFAEDMIDDLKQPGTQAILIIGVSAIIAAGCFYFAYLLDGDDEASGENRS